MTPAVLVVLPARDEQDAVTATVRGVCRALDEARARGLVGACTVEVAAHRCLDETAVRARAALEGRYDGRVRADGTSSTVGQVRDAAARRGLARLGTPPEDTWLLSTDADTDVGTDWVSRVLEAAARADAVAVVGVTDLDRWRGSERAAAAYARQLASKTYAGEHGPLHEHGHVYGANLAVRADAYLDVGGFPHVVHGEDQALVDALAARGHRVLRTTAVSVVTSGRLHGRAAHGLADHLARLDGPGCPAVGRDVGTEDLGVA